MRWILRAKAGDKVCLVNDLSPLRRTDWGRLLDLEFPEVGGIYTIREIRPSGYDDGMVGILLSEVLNMPCGIIQRGGWCEKPDHVAEPAFDWRDFRPVDRSKADISIFKSLLNPSRERADA